MTRVQKEKMMKESLIETYAHKGEGYNPFFIKDHWQVAQLNYMAAQGLSSITKMDMHLQTDEIFILTKGTAILIAAVNDKQSFRFELTKMVPGIVYNIPVGLWHNIAMDVDAEILIVEKSNTHLGDFVYQDLNNDERNELNQQIADLLNKEQNHK